MVTIEVPTVETEALARLDETTQDAAETETSALTLIREKYGPLAKYNGYIKTLERSEAWGTSRSRGSEEYLTTADLLNGSTHKYLGAKIRAFVIVDDYVTEKHTDFTGEDTGDRLYLTEASQWIETTRTGTWSHWEDSTSEWTATDRVMTDEEVADEWALDDILEGIAKALAGLNERIPDKYRRVRERAELAKRTIAALTEES